MAQKTVQGSSTLAESIRTRRNELELTIEEAASKAGIGTKTWSRYESGESIRADKCKGVCKALNWVKLPESDENTDDPLDLDQYETHEAWSEYLLDSFGKPAAVSFAVGSDILLDHINEDMCELSQMPKETHIGQIGISFLMDSLPPQFLMEYDYNFLYTLRTNVKRFRMIAHTGKQLIAHSVLDELTLFLVVEESRLLLDEEDALDRGWDEWVFDVFDDMDLITFLYSDQYLSDSHQYHFSHWAENQFYCEHNRD